MFNFAVCPPSSLALYPASEAGTLLIKPAEEKMERYIALAEILKQGSFTRASESLGYTQSALSQMIASLENELGIRLLNRSHFGAVLSPDGEKVFPMVEQMLKAHEQIHNKARQINGLEDEIIRIASFSSVSTHWLPYLFKKFKSLYPNVDFIITSGNEMEIVMQGKANFGFIATADPPSARGLRYKTVKEGFHKAILPKGHPLAKLDIIPLDKLLTEPFLVNELSDASEVLEALQVAGYKPDSEFKIENDSAIMSMVEQGLGVSLLSDLSLNRCSYDIEIRPTEPPLRRIISIACQRPENLSEAERRFIDFILSEAKNLP